LRYDLKATVDLTMKKAMISRVVWGTQNKSMAVQSAINFPRKRLVHGTLLLAEAYNYSRQGHLEGKNTWPLTHGLEAQPLRDNSKAQKAMDVYTVGSR
jgi:hypothetical protein